MDHNLALFKKRKRYLICVDSDGCAMNTMDIKHFRCFGPCLVAEWGLEQYQDEILPRWTEINLYTMNRGLNRFQNLAIMLTEIDEKYCHMEGLKSLTQWVKNTPEPSASLLERTVREQDSICLKKALSWSMAVDKALALLPQEERYPFECVRRALAHAHRYADIVVVSSARLETVLDEWDLYGLLEYTDTVLAEDTGSKSYCIRQLLKLDYAAHNVLMCGDAVSDLDAAKENHILFYPILAKFENESWMEFVSEGFERLLNGTYEGDYQQKKIQAFLKNLGG